MILENLKQYVLLVISMEIILLIWIWQTINKTTRQNILKNLNCKRRPQTDSKLKKLKEDVLNSATALLKGREMVLKAFESWIFLSNEQWE